MKRGVDTSRIQPVLTSHEWRRTGLDFAYIKSGNGNGEPDECFVPQMTNARTAGLAVGAYHVGFPLRHDPRFPGRDPEEQARAHFMLSGALGQLPGTMPIALDLEWPEPKDWAHWQIDAAFILQWAKTYLEVMEHSSGRTPIIYTYPDFWTHVASGQDTAWIKRYGLWLAAYDVEVPPGLEPWTECVLWQRGGGTGYLEGCPVDEDVFLGDDEAWDRFLGLT